METAQNYDTYYITWSSMVNMVVVCIVYGDHDESWSWRERTADR